MTSKARKYHEDNKTIFLEIKTNDMTYSELAEQIGINKSTISNWMIKEPLSGIKLKYLNNAINTILDSRSNVKELKHSSARIDAFKPLPIAELMKIADSLNFKTFEELFTNLTIWDCDPDKDEVRLVFGSYAEYRYSRITGRTSALHRSLLD